MERLELRQLMAADSGITPFQNPQFHPDVNDDGKLTPRDVLAVVREINERGARPLELAASEPGETVANFSRQPFKYFDVNGDHFLNNRDALAVIRALAAAGEPGDVVTFSMETTDLNGNPLTSTTVGTEFLLHVFTQDTQATADLFGVFSAYLDVTYTANLATVVANPTFPGIYTEGKSGSIAIDGEIDEVGAFVNSSTATGRNRLEVFSVRMRADSPGNLVFASNPADVLPKGEVSVFNSDDAVSPQDILYGGTTLTITGSQGGAPDLAAFGRALTAAGVQLWSTQFSARGRVAQQLNLFQDGESFLPFREAIDPDTGSLNAAAQAANVTALNTWIFPDQTRSNGPLLTLEQISQRSGVPIPNGISPSIAPIPDATVLLGSPLHIPLDGYDPNGDPITYSVTVSNSGLLSTSIPTGNRSLRIAVGDTTGEFGEMVLQLFENQVPRVTEHIIQLTNDNFFDNKTFDRVIDGFVIQGGGVSSPLGQFDDQFHVDLQHNRTGVLSMAKTDDDTNDAQFFIVEDPESTRHLDFNHSVFGQLIEGERVRQTISNLPTGNGNRPTLTVTMSSVDVFADSENGILVLKGLQGTGTTDVTVTATDSKGNSTTETFTVTMGIDNINSGPFLADIPDQSFGAGTPIQFQLNSTDIEGDAVTYSADALTAGAEATVTATGLVTVTPPSGFTTGELRVLVSVDPANDIPLGASDTQEVRIVVTANTLSPPTAIDLLAVSDTGLSDQDHVTNDVTPSFSLSGVASGANVRLYINNQIVAEGIATGTSITLTSNSLDGITDDVLAVDADQQLNGATSPRKTLTHFRLDRTIPVAVPNRAPGVGTINQPYVFDANHEEEGLFAKYSLTSSPTGMTIDPVTGQVNWTPTASQAGNQTFAIRITDLAGNESVPTSITIAVDDLVANAVNDTINVVAEQVLDVLANDTPSVSGGTLLITAITQPSSGTVSVTSGNAAVRYVPVAGFAGTVSFNYTITDNRGKMDSATVTLNVGNNTLNNDPLAFNDEFDVPLTPGTLTLDVLANDTTLPDAGETLVIDAIVTAPTQGTAVLNEAKNRILYTPSVNFSDEDTFTYRISDGRGGTDVATVVIAGQPSNAAPVAVNDSFSVTSIAEQTLDVLANDTTDVGETLRVTAVETTGTRGTVTINPDGTRILYRAATGFTGNDTFRYTINDGNGQTAQGTVTVNVTIPVTDSKFIAGSVYLDLDNDGERDANERGLSGVTIALNGTKATGGETIQRTATTDLHGNYRFSDLAAGSYTVTEGQPEFIVDGKERFNGQGLETNQIQVTLGGATAGIDNVLFGERGFAGALNRVNTIASQRGDSLLVVMQGSRVVWIQDRGGWDDITSITVGIQGNQMTLNGTGSGETRGATLSTLNPRQVYRLGFFETYQFYQVLGGSDQVLQGLNASAVDSLLTAT